MTAGGRVHEPGTAAAGLALAAALAAGAALAACPAVAQQPQPAPATTNETDAVVRFLPEIIEGSRAPAEPPTATYWVYAAAESQDEVAVIRFGPAGAELVEAVPVGPFATEIDGPHGMDVGPDGNRWYVSIAHGIPFGHVYAYETGTNRQVGEVEVGMFPATLEASPAGLLFVVNFNLHGDPVPSSVSVIATGPMVEVARITTCRRPHGSRFTDDFTRHYSVCVMDDQLVEIDARTLRVSRRMYLEPGAERPLPPDVVAGPDADAESRCGPTWVQPDPTGELAYVACNKNDQVLEIDLGEWEVSRRFETGEAPYNLDVTSDGRLLVVSYKGEQATGVFSIESGQEIAAIPSTRRLPHGVVVSPDSRYAFVTVEGVGGEPGTVDVIDLDALKKVASVDMGKQAGGIAFWKMEEVEEADSSAAAGELEGERGGR